MAGSSDGEDRLKSDSLDMRWSIGMVTSKRGYVSLGTTAHSHEDNCQWIVTNNHEAEDLKCSSSNAFSLVLCEAEKMVLKSNGEFAVDDKS